jgi:hypothetical protein
MTYSKSFCLAKNVKLGKKYQERVDRFVGEMTDNPMQVNNEAIFNKDHDKYYKFRQSIKVKNDLSGTLERYVKGRSTLNTVTNQNLQKVI